MIKFFRCEQLEETGLVKTAYTSNVSGVRWKIYSQDPEHTCLRYYEEFAKMMGITVNDMIRIPQRHTTNIKIATRKDGGSGIIILDDDILCDAIITNEKKLMICTIEADCVPVFILDTEKKAIGMVHSGWKGTVGNIAVKTINKMKENYGTNFEDLLIYFGPSICADCYEVREDVVYEFSKIFDNEKLLKIIKKKNKDDSNLIDDFNQIKNKFSNGNIEELCDEKFLLDVEKAIKIKLIENGVCENKIFSSNYCTYHNSDLFDSYRKNKNKAGHILSGIMLK